MRSKKLIVYEDRKTGSLFIRSTKISEDGQGFVLRPHEFGKAVSGKVSDAELGKAVRKIFLNCE
jgi:hypothetical protein